MLTLGQEKWIAHLSNKDRIRIVPFDPTAEAKFQKVKQKIRSVLGDEIAVEHRGATSLGISGQDEIDVYVPTPPDKFNSLVDSLGASFGKPKSLYPLERARFVIHEGGKHVDVFLINEECDGWKNGIRFEAHLKSHPESLESYRQLKESGNGLTVREYYRRKIEFINDILDKSDKF